MKIKSEITDLEIIDPRMIDVKNKPQITYQENKARLHI